MFLLYPGSQWQNNVTVFLLTKRPLIKVTRSTSQWSSFWFPILPCVNYSVWSQSLIDIIYPYYIIQSQWTSYFIYYWNLHWPASLLHGCNWLLIMTEGYNLFFRISGYHVEHQLSHIWHICHVLAFVSCSYCLLFTPPLFVSLHKSLFCSLVSARFCSLSERW